MYIYFNYSLVAVTISHFLMLLLRVHKYACVNKISRKLHTAVALLTNPNSAIIDPIVFTLKLVFIKLFRKLF